MRPDKNLRQLVVYLDPVRSDPPEQGQDICQIYYLSKGSTQALKARIGATIYQLAPAGAGSSHNPLTLAASDAGAHVLNVQELLGITASVAQRGHMSPDHVAGLEIALAHANSEHGGGDLDEGIISYDYVIDPNYTGSDGDVLTIGTKSQVIVYKTIQACIDAIDLDAGSTHLTIWIAGATYSESVTIPSTIDRDLTFIGEARSSVLWGGTGAADVALTIEETTNNFYFHHINFRGGSSGASVRGAGSPDRADFHDCEFDRSFSLDADNSLFFACKFDQGYDVISTHSPNVLWFIGCTLSSTSQWDGDLQDATFVGCHWSGASDIIVSTGVLGNLNFQGCRMPSGKWFHKNGGGGGTIKMSGCKIGGPSADGSIHIQSASGTVHLLLNEVTFQASGSSPYIKSETAQTRLSIANCELEDNGSIDITGIFTNSTFGPNTPPDTNVELLSGSAGCVYIGTGSVTGADALDAVAPLPQRGTAAPSHTAPEGTLFWDITNNKFYVNNNGSTSWTEIGAGGGAALTVQDEDGTPQDVAVTIIRVPNNGMIDNGVGDVSLLFIPYTAFDTKGDLLVATGADAYTRLAAAANGASLETASGEATGLKWTIAKRTIILTARGGEPTTTAGCAAAVKAEIGATNDIDLFVLDFDSTLAESAFWEFPMPDNYDGGTITAKFYWTASTTGTPGVVFGIKGRAFADDEAIDQAYGTEVETADTFIASGDVHVSPESSAITLGGTPAGGELVQIKVTRKVAHGSDTLAADARLIAVKLEYTTNAVSD